MGRRENDAGAAEQLRNLLMGQLTRRGETAATVVAKTRPLTTTDHHCPVVATRREKTIESRTQQAGVLDLQIPPTNRNDQSLPVCGYGTRREGGINRICNNSDTGYQIGCVLTSKGLLDRHAGRIGLDDSGIRSADYREHVARFAPMKGS